MRKALPVLAFAGVLAFAAGHVRVEDITGGTGPISKVEFQYDDDTPAWVIGDFVYYGTWFDPTDFLPGGTPSFDIYWVEWWFYHSPVLPWDTDMISLEIWYGDSEMPVVQVEQDDVNAVHCAPVRIYYDLYDVHWGFWTICNTIVHSARRSPTGIYDGTLNFTGIPHTFGSNDYILWQPIVAGGVPVDVLHRVTVEIFNLYSESWGAIKGLHRQ